MVRKGSIEPPIIACAVLPAFPLQVALRSFPHWKEAPAAIVEADKPHAKLLWVNSHAYTAGVRTGMRYVAALSLAGNLQAKTSNALNLDAAVLEVIEALQEFSPTIEASPTTHDPGTFWIGTAGLKLVFASAKPWAQHVKQCLEALGYSLALTLGQGRFSTYAIARERAYQGVYTTLICRNEREERRYLNRVSLETLPLPPKDREELTTLGLFTVGDFVALPEDGVARRYSEEVLDLWRQLKGVLELPVASYRKPETFAAHFSLEQSSSDSVLFLFLIKRMLPRLLDKLASRGLALRELVVRLRYEQMRTRLEDEVLSISTAEPTRNEVSITDLVRLRLERLELKGEIADLFLEAIGAPVETEQQDLFKERPKRDLQAASRAIARLRAELGPEHVTRMVPKDLHLPEAQFSLEPVEGIACPSSVELPLTFSLVRRLYPSPIPLHWQDHLHEESLPPFLPDYRGPYKVSGGWWGRKDNRSTTRYYKYVHTANGDLLWVYFDAVRGRWFLHGKVE